MGGNGRGEPRPRLLSRPRTRSQPKLGSQSFPFLRIRRGQANQWAKTHNGAPRARRHATESWRPDFGADVAGLLTTTTGSGREQRAPLCLRSPPGPLARKQRLQLSAPTGGRHYCYRQRLISLIVVGFATRSFIIAALARSGRVAILHRPAGRQAGGPAGRIVLARPADRANWTRSGRST